MKLRICSTAIVAFAAVSLNAASANAGILVSDAPSCDAQPLSTPFAQWGDGASYTPVSGGGFESGAAGWTLTGGARVSTGNESFKVRAASDASSLYIPAGGSATSPTMCVGLEHPTMRFFSRQNTGGLLGASSLQVEVLFQSLLGPTSLPIGVVLPNTSWAPSLPMTIVANLLPLLPGAHTPVAFRFTPLLGGDWSIDDAYVDPYQRR